MPVTGEAADNDALDLAMQSLNLALQRHLDARERKVLVEAFASAAESVWWICAIDEQLGPKGSPYAQARDRDQFGGTSRGCDGFGTGTPTSCP